MDLKGETPSRLKKYEKIKNHYNTVTNDVSLCVYGTSK